MNKKAIIITAVLVVVFASVILCGFFIGWFTTPATPAPIASPAPTSTPFKPTKDKWDQDTWFGLLTSLSDEQIIVSIDNEDVTFAMSERGRRDVVDLEIKEGIRIGVNFDEEEGGIKRVRNLEVEQ